MRNLVEILLSFKYLALIN